MARNNNSSCDIYYTIPRSWFALYRNSGQSLMDNIPILALETFRSISGDISVAGLSTLRPLPKDHVWGVYTVMMVDKWYDGKD